MTHRKTSSDSVYTCKVRLFRDEESLVVKFQKHVTGEWLLDYVCGQLNLLEKYYFGFRYTDQNSIRRWLDLSGAVIKQVKDLVKDSICFRVRYYPASPALLKEDLTRYYLYMQLRRDAFHGRLVTRGKDVPALAAFVMQSELGDFEDVELDTGFTKDIELLPKMASTMEDQIISAYKELSGLSPAEAEGRFIELVRSLDSYGIDQLSVKDKQGQQLHIGSNHHGVALFQSFKRIRLIEWDSITKCVLDGKSVSITTLEPDIDEKPVKQVSKYKCSDEQAALSLWTCILDQQAFFTLHSHQQAKSVRSGGLFKRSNKFKFSGHCYDEVVDDSNKIRRLAPDFVRASSLSLNRSQSIRSSKRTPLKRGSQGSVPQSKSLPISFTEDSLNGTDDGMTPQILHTEDATPKVQEVENHINGDDLGAWSESAGETDTVPEEESTIDEVATASNMELAGTKAKTRRPVAVELEITPVYQTRSAPKTPEVLELEVSPPLAGSVTSGPTRTMPEISVSENTDPDSSTLSGEEAAEEYTLTSASEDSGDDCEIFETVSCEHLAVEDAQNGGIELQQVHETVEHGNNSELGSQAIGADLKLDLDKLTGDSAEGQSLHTDLSSSSSSKVRSFPWLRLVILLVIPVILAIGMYIVFQSDANYMKVIKETEAFQQLRDNYLIPFSMFVRRHL